MAGRPISATPAQNSRSGISAKHQRATDWVMPACAGVRSRADAAAPGPAPVWLLTRPLPLSPSLATGPVPVWPLTCPPPPEASNPSEAAPVAFRTWRRVRLGICRGRILEVGYTLTTDSRVGGGYGNE